MKILVKYDNSYYYWVDTVTTCAILVSSKGVAFPINLNLIKVVDDSYNYEKQIQRKIKELKNENFMLNQQMQLDSEIQDLYSKKLFGVKELKKD